MSHRERHRDRVDPAGSDLAWPSWGGNCREARRVDGLRQLDRRTCGGRSTSWVHRVELGHRPGDVGVRALAVLLAVGRAGPRRTAIPEASPSAIRDTPSGSRSGNAWASERVASHGPGAVRHQHPAERPPAAREAGGSRSPVGCRGHRFARPRASASQRRVARRHWRRADPAVRVGDDRILYQVDDARSVVIVVRVADRREAYRPADPKRLLARLRESP